MGLPQVSANTVTGTDVYATTLHYNLLDPAIPTPTLDSVLTAGDTSATNNLTLTAGTLTAEQLTSTDDLTVQGDTVTIQTSANGSAYVTMNANGIGQSCEVNFYDDTVLVGRWGYEGSNTLNFTSYSAGIPVQLRGLGVINFMPSGDLDDYIQFTTTSHVPRIGTVGSCDLEITSSSGEISFDNENLTTTGTVQATGGFVSNGNTLTVDETKSLSDYILVGGTRAFTGPQSLGNNYLTDVEIIYLADGSESTPSYTFTNDTDTGMYSGGADVLAFSTNGTTRILIDHTLDGIELRLPVQLGTNNLTTTGTVQAEHFYTTDDLQVADDILLGSGSVINFDSGNATITHSAGILTFNVFPVTPSAAPDADYEVANKKYVDDNAFTSPLTTKGDVYTYDTGDQRLAVGSDDQVLRADSATATGLKWAGAAIAQAGAPATVSGNIWLDTDDTSVIPSNADTVDNYHASQTATADTILPLDSNGDLDLDGAEIYNNTSDGDILIDINDGGTRRNAI